jgi:imidazolonepropionase-like amidohydrolase
MKNLLCILFLLMIFSGEPTEYIDTGYTAFTGATLIDGSGAAPKQNAVLLIHHGRIIAIGTKENLTLPAGTEMKDVAGKFIIPGFINAHGHVGDVKGIEAGHYSKQNIIDNLSTYARYGVTAVVSLGGDRREAESLRAVIDTAATGHARLYIAGEVISGNTPGEAMKVIDSNAKMGVDLMKIRVDDNLGTTPKMKEEVYRAVIRHSHELGYKIATHMYYLDDAKKLLDAGSDMMAHSVRDKPVDTAFIRSLKEKKVCYCPTLTRELSTFVYADTAGFFSDEFFRREYDSATIAPLEDPANMTKVKNSKAARTYKQQLSIAMANLKKLSDNGVTIVMGTDTGLPGRFMGYFEHVEMQMMAEAGMTPEQIIVSATKNAAVSMGLKDIGLLAPGYHADFVILNDNPLTDIRNTRKITSVFIGGEEVRR